MAQTEFRREHFGSGSGRVWQTQTVSNGAVAYDSTIHILSAYSMKVTISVAAGRAYLRNDMANSIGEYYAGLWYYVPTATYNTLDAAADGAYFMMFCAEDSGFAAQAEVRLQTVSGTPVLLFTPNDGSTTSTTTFPTRDAWHFIEWYWKKGAASTGAYQWWSDGVSIASSSSVTNSANDMAKMNVGARYSATATTSDGFYIGGFAADSAKRITMANRLRDRVSKRVSSGFL